MNRHRLFTIAVALIVLANLGFGWAVHRRVAAETGEIHAFTAFDELGNVIRLIRQHYVDPDKVSYAHLLEGAIHGMLNGLDPFSSYFPPQQYEEVQEQSHGQFGGIGVIIAMEDNKLTVVEPMADSPGERAGLQAGDKIIGVDGKQLGDNVILESAIKLIKGEPGTRVMLTILRKGEVFEVEIERAVIDVPTVVDTTFVAPGIGYLRITQFNEKTVDELGAALLQLGSSGLEGLVIDLRYNPGGLLQAAQGVCSYFLPNGELIVYTEGRSKRNRQDFYAFNGMKLLELPVVILINGSSASAAEIVAGCLQDTDRAVLIGEKSFGKGTVQTPYHLEDGGAIHLTTAHYYTPGRRNIHGNGIEPDLVIPTADSPDHVPFRKPRADSGDVPEIQDVQLRGAIEALAMWRRGPRPTDEQLRQLVPVAPAAGTASADARTETEGK